MSSLLLHLRWSRAIVVLSIVPEGHDRYTFYTDINGTTLKSWILSSGSSAIPGTPMPLVSGYSYYSFNQLSRVPMKQAYTLSLMCCYTEVGQGCLKHPESNVVLIQCYFQGLLQFEKQNHNHLRISNHHC